MSFKSMLVVAAVAAIGSSGPAGAAQSATAGLSDAELRAQLEARILETPGSDIMVEIRRLYPEEFADFERQMIAGVRRGGSNEDARRTGARFMTDFFTRHMPATQKAPVAEMVAMAGANAALARTLKSEDIQACVGVVWGGGLGLSGRAGLSARAIANLGAYQRSVIAAMAAGEKSPTQHRQFGDADTAALIKALIAAGADETAVGIIDNGGEGAPSPEASCEAGVFLMDALASLPPESQAAFMSAQ